MIICMKKMVIASVMLFALLLSGCATLVKSREVPENFTFKNRQDVLRHIPPGTDYEKAAGVLMKAGYQCTMQPNMLRGRSKKAALRHQTQERPVEERAVSFQPTAHAGLFRGDYRPVYQPYGYDLKYTAFSIQCADDLLTGQRKVTAKSAAFEVGKVQCVSLLIQGGVVIDAQVSYTATFQDMAATNKAAASSR